MGQFKDKTVLVTGGGQGIGRAVAEAFAAAGGQIIILEKDEQAGTETADAISHNGGECIFSHVDISDERSLSKGLADIGQRVKKLDIVINNAGISMATPLSAEMAAWDAVIGTNLRGAYLAVKYAVPLLRTGGSIINIASTRALMSEPDWHAYAAAKGGLVALTHSLAVSLGPQGIRVNAISPGWIDVSGWKKAGNRNLAELRPEDHAQHPVGRVGKPEDIAAACLFLASPGAGFITGTNLVVDGGMTVKMIYAD